MRATSLAIAMAVGGCGPSITPPAATGDGGGTTTSPVVPTSTTSAMTGTDSSSSSTPDTTADGSTSMDSAAFVPVPDGGAEGCWQCDTYAQDCPAGTKCTRFGCRGSSVYDGTFCAPVDEAPDEVGEPCSAHGDLYDGIDSCDIGAMCLPFGSESDGLCMAFCTGSESLPSCEEPGTYCYSSGDVGQYPQICRPWCDPTAQDCVRGQGCYPTGGGGPFSCSVDASGDVGQPGDVCEFVSSCDPGNLCVAAEVIPGCEGIGCCSPVCDLSDPMPPCPPGQSCTPWYETAEAWPDLEHVGVCAAP